MIYGVNAFEAQLIASFFRFSVVGGMWLCGKVRGMNSNGFVEWPISFGAKEGGRGIGQPLRSTVRACDGNPCMTVM